MRGLIKNYSKVRALDGLDLTVERGEVHGFLGPNGSGKSTTIRALLGQLRSDGGQSRILGQDCWSDAVAVHRRLAYVPGDVALWDSLTGGECIDVLVSLQGRQDRKRRAELIERFELDPTRRTRTYSKGNRQKVALIAALCKQAEVLLLDEPTSGLDPLMEEVFQRCVLEEKDRGATILLSSHILSEVERLCERATIIRQGRAISTGSIRSLRGGASVQVTAVTRRPPTDLGEGLGVTDLAVTGVDGAVQIRAHVRQEAIGIMMGHLTTAGIVSLTVEPPSLNDLFLNSYRDETSKPPTSPVPGCESRQPGQPVVTDTGSLS